MMKVLQEFRDTVYRAQERLEPLSCQAVLLVAVVEGLTGNYANLYPVVKQALQYFEIDINKISLHMKKDNWTENCLKRLKSISQKIRQFLLYIDMEYEYLYPGEFSLEGCLSVEYFCTQPISTKDVSKKQIEKATEILKRGETGSCELSTKLKDLNSELCPGIIKLINNSCVFQGKFESVITVSSIKLRIRDPNSDLNVKKLVRSICLNSVVQNF